MMLHVDCSIAALYYLHFGAMFALDPEIPSLLSKTNQFRLSPAEFTK